MGNDQKPRCSSSIVIETRNFKILPFLPHGYHTPKLKNIASLAIAFSPHNFKVLPTCHMELFWVSNQTFFGGGEGEIGRNYASIIITIISNITVLGSHNNIFFGYFMPFSHGVNKKASSTPLPNQVFARFVCCFTRNTLSNFFSSDLTDYCKNNVFSKSNLLFFFQLIAVRF